MYGSEKKFGGGVDLGGFHWFWAYFFNFQAFELYYCFMKIYIAPQDSYSETLPVLIWMLLRSNWSSGWWKMNTAQVTDWFIHASNVIWCAIVWGLVCVCSCQSKGWRFKSMLGQKLVLRFLATYKEMCVCVSRWVHLVCALYVPGVAFGDVEKLNNITLFEMNYSKWGSKVRLVPFVVILKNNWAW